MCDLLLWSVVGHRLWQLAFWFPMLMIWGREAFVAIGDLIWTAWPSIACALSCVLLYINGESWHHSKWKSDAIPSCFATITYCHSVDTYIFLQLPTRSVEVTNCDLLTVSRLHIRMQVVTWCQFQLAPYLVIGSPLVAVIGVVGMVNCFKWKSGRTLSGRRVCDLNQGKWSH